MPNINKQYKKPVKKRKQSRRETSALESVYEIYKCQAIWWNRSLKIAKQAGNDRPLPRPRSH